MFFRILLMYMTVMRNCNDSNWGIISFNVVSEISDRIAILIGENYGFDWGISQYFQWYIGGKILFNGRDTPTANH